MPMAHGPNPNNFAFSFVAADGRSYIQYKTASAPRPYFQPSAAHCQSFNRAAQKSEPSGQLCLNVNVLNPSRSSHLTSSVWCQRIASERTARVLSAPLPVLHDRTLTYRYLARKGLDSGFTIWLIFDCGIVTPHARVIIGVVYVQYNGKTAGQFPLRIFSQPHFALS